MKYQIGDKVINKATGETLTIEDVYTATRNTPTTYVMEETEGIYFDRELGKKQS